MTERFFEYIPLSRKYHVFDKGELRPLCGKWMFKGQEDTPVNGTETWTKEDCKVCFKKAGLKITEVKKE